MRVLVVEDARPLAAAIADGLRGQAFGLNATGGMGGQGLFPPVAGALALAFGAGAAMAIAGLATVLAALALRAPLTGRWRATGPGKRPR